MTLEFRTTRDDALALTNAYLSTSPTAQRNRRNLRIFLPATLLSVWLLILATRGFEWPATVISFTLGALWCLIYPAMVDRRIRRSAEKSLDERGNAKCLGPCTLTLSDEGLHSISALGECRFAWSVVDHVTLTPTHLFILLPGPMGYAVPVAQVGQEAATTAFDLARTRFRAPS